MATTPPADPLIERNCDCDTGLAGRTLADLRAELLTRLGLAGASNGGIVALINSFLAGAQRQLYLEHAWFRNQRFFTWDMPAGTRFYDVDANRDTCTLAFDPAKISGAWVSEDDANWLPLAYGIDPMLYTYPQSGRPKRYEIRQCIEVWPAPSAANYKLRLKGEFGLMAFAADADKSTIDPQAILLLALANAKAHYGQPDAKNIFAELSTYLGALSAATHTTQRYIPGEAEDTGVPFVYRMRGPF